MTVKEALAEAKHLIIDLETLTSTFQGQELLDGVNSLIQAGYGLDADYEKSLAEWRTKNP